MNWKRAFAALAAAAGLVAVPALGANATVTITKNGFEPASVTVNTGETVTFTNSDTKAHEVVFQKTTGVSCAASPLVLQPTQSGSCTFSSAGKFSYSDPTHKGFKGSVVVQGAAASVTLSVSAQRVVYGGTATLTGTVSNQAANEQVRVQAQVCGAGSSSTVATVTTTSGGAYSYAAGPVKNTAYSVRWKSATSGATTVKVRPRLKLSKLAPHRYRIRVSAAESFAGKVAKFQRYNRATSEWVTVRTVTLRPGPSATPPTVISSARFKSRVRAHARVRAVLSLSQVGACYIAGRSNLIFS
jgi:plastocyanin